MVLSCYLLPLAIIYNFLYLLYDKSFKNPLFQKTYLKLPCSFNTKIPQSFIIFYLITIVCLFILKSKVNWKW